MRSTAGRSIRVRLRVGVIAATLIAGLGALPATPASAAAASPSSYSIDCSLLAPAGTTIAGAVGDTFTIANTSGTVCPLAGEAGIVNGQSAVGPNLSEQYSIVGGGTFTLTTWTGAANGSASVTIVVTSSSEHIPGVGEPRPQDLPSAPSPGSAPVATGGGGKITVTWSPPASSGEDTVIRYLVVAHPSSAACTTFESAGNPPTTCVFTNVPMSQLQTFTVQAQTPIGWGPASAESNAAMAIPLPPGKPTAVSLTPVDPKIDGLEMTLGIGTPARLGSYPIDHVEYQLTRCARPCAAVPASTDWSQSQTLPAAGGTITVPDRQTVWFARARNVDSIGHTSDWVVGMEKRPSDFPKVPSVTSYADADEFFVGWQKPATHSQWVWKYLLVVCSGKTAAQAVSCERYVPWFVTPDRHVQMSTSDRAANYISLNDLGRDGDRYFRFGVVVYYGTADMDYYESLTTLSNHVVEFTDQVPAPQAVNAAIFNPVDRELSFEWQAPDAKETGASNVVGYEVEYFNFITSEWLSAGVGYPVSAAGKRQHITLPTYVKGNFVQPMKVRVRSVAWPDRSYSSWVSADTTLTSS